MRALCFISSLMAALTVLPVQAQVQTGALAQVQIPAPVAPRTKHRWFLSLGISPLRYSRFSVEENDTPSRSSSRLDLALGGPATLAIGYGVLEVFVVEMQASVQRIQNDDDEDDEGADPPLSVFDNTKSTTAVTMGPTARLYLTRSVFQPFIEAGFGFGYVHTETPERSFSLKSLSARAGVGGQWRFADAASVSTAFDIGFESTSGETSVDDATLIPVRGNSDRTTQLREAELGGDTVVLGLDVWLTVWL